MRILLAFNFLWIFHSFCAQISFSEAKAFMINRCKNINQIYIDGIEANFNGTKMYAFLTKSADYKVKYCSSVMNTKELKLLAADCGGIEKVNQFSVLLDVNSSVDNVVLKEIEIGFKNMTKDTLTVCDDDYRNPFIKTRNLFDRLETRNIKMENQFDRLTVNRINSALAEKRNIEAKCLSEMLFSKDISISQRVEKLDSESRQNYQIEVEKFEEKLRLLWIDYDKNPNTFLSKHSDELEIVEGRESLYIYRSGLFSLLNEKIDTTTNVDDKSRLLKIYNQAITDGYYYKRAYLDGTYKSVLVPLAPSGNLFNYENIDSIFIDLHNGKPIQWINGGGGVIKTNRLSWVRFYKKDSLVHAAPIVNSFGEKVSYIHFKTPEIDSINNHNSDQFGGKPIWYESNNYVFSKSRKFSSKNLSKINRPEAGYFYDKYDKCLAEFHSILSEENCHLCQEEDNSIEYYATKCHKKFDFQGYHPITLYLMKQFYPKADSVAFCKISKAEAKELGDHVLQYAQQSANHFGYDYNNYCALIPIQKGVIEIKDGFLRVFKQEDVVVQNGIQYQVKSYNTDEYKKYKVQLMPKSIVSLRDFNLDASLNDDKFQILDEHFFYDLPKEVNIYTGAKPLFFYSSKDLIIPIYSISTVQNQTNLPPSYKYSIPIRTNSSFSQAKEDYDYFEHLIRLYAKEKMTNSKKADKYLKKAKKALKSFESWYRSTF